MQFRHKISGGDFAKAGNVASAVKKILHQLNINHSVSKRIVIALYEGEVNVVAHAYSGIIEVNIDEEKIETKITDKGPGISDIEEAMKEGYSTATPQVRNGVWCWNGIVEYEEEQRLNEDFECAG